MNFHLDYPETLTFLKPAESNRPAWEESFLDQLLYIMNIHIRISNRFDKNYVDAEALILTIYIYVYIYIYILELYRDPDIMKTTLRVRPFDLSSHRGLR